MYGTPHGTPQALSLVTVMVLPAAKCCRACGPLQQGWGLPAACSREGCSGADTRCALAGLAPASLQLLGLSAARRREQMFGSAPQAQQGSSRPPPAPSRTGAGACSLPLNASCSTLANSR